MIKILVTAPKGKMGRLIIKAAAASGDLQVAGALGPKGREYIGQDVGQAAGLGRDLGVFVGDDLNTMIGACDVIVDFSTVETTMQVLEIALAHNKPMICGGTGFSGSQEAAMIQASKTIPFLKAANTSYIVNVMRKLLEIAATALGDKCHIDVIDMHDEKKADAPSGTAKELGHVMTAASGKNPEEIDYHSIRSGDIPSSHTVIFGTTGERLEITHHSYNWECYAYGACDAARFLYEKSAGLYTMEDVIEDKSQF